MFSDQDSAVAKVPYLKVDANLKNDKVPKLVEFIHHTWQVPEPSLIISVTGGAADFAMKENDHFKLRQGLQRIAATEGAWLITGGTDAGIMKICGEAMRHQIFNSIPIKCLIF